MRCVLGSIVALLLAADIGHCESERAADIEAAANLAPVRTAVRPATSKGSGGTPLSDPDGDSPLSDANGAPPLPDPNGNPALPAPNGDSDGATDGSAAPVAIG